MADAINCKQCNGQMAKTKKTDRSLSKQLLGVAVFIFGLCLLFVFPIGTVVGATLMLVSLGMGYKQTKVWMCKNCGYFFERAV